MDIHLTFSSSYIVIYLNYFIPERFIVINLQIFRSTCNKTGEFRCNKEIRDDTFIARDCIVLENAHSVSKNYHLSLTLLKKSTDKIQFSTKRFTFTNERS